MDLERIVVHRFVGAELRLYEPNSVTGLPLSPHFALFKNLFINVSMMPLSDDSSHDSMFKSEICFSIIS